MSLFDGLVGDEGWITLNLPEETSAKMAAKKDERAAKKAARKAAREERRANRRDVVYDIFDKIDGTPVGTALDYASDLVLGTNLHDMDKPSDDSEVIDDTDDTDDSGGNYYTSGSSSKDAGSNKSQYNNIIDQINAITKANNEWSAAQAQKQMDFQKMMSDTAHQREVADLKAAGLNPVLSAGGSGAPVTSGAMGDTDTSNGRLIAEVAMTAIDAVNDTAKSFSGIRSKKQEVAKNGISEFLGKMGTSAATGFARSLGYALGRRIF